MPAMTLSYRAQPSLPCGKYLQTPACGIVPSAAGTRFRRGFRSRSGMMPPAGSPPSASRVTSTTGVFIVDRSRCISIAPCRAKSSRRNFRAGIFEGSGEIILSYAGIGIAMLTLIENTVRVTIRHSDSEPIASAVATASISRDEGNGRRVAFKASGAGRPYHGRVPSLREANHSRHR